LGIIGVATGSLCRNLRRRRQQPCSWAPVMAPAALNVTNAMHLQPPAAPVPASQSFVRVQVTLLFLIFAGPQAAVQPTPGMGFLAAVTGSGAEPACASCGVGAVTD
jgi:hypothetical protein